MTRMLIGSVTTRILRCATCSVLTVPHAAAMTQARTTVDPPVVNVLERPEWGTGARLIHSPLGDLDLSRSIGHVAGIDVLTDDRGRDVALRIAHGAGQTLLTFG